MSESFSRIQELLRERADYEARLKLLPGLSRRYRMLLIRMTLKIPEQIKHPALVGHRIHLNESDGLYYHSPAGLVNKDPPEFSGGS